MSVERELVEPFEQAARELNVRPSSPGAGSSPLTRSQPRNEVGGRTLGPVVEVFTDVWEAHDRRAGLGREYCVTAHIDGFCIRKWIEV